MLDTPDKQGTESTKIAEAISLCFSPIITISVLAVLFFKTQSEFHEFAWIFALYFLIIPAMFPLFAYAMGALKDLTISNRKDRNFYYSVFFWSGFIGLVHLFSYHPPPEIKNMALLGVWTIATLTLVNDFVFKVSVHACTLSALVLYVLIYTRSEIFPLAELALFIALPIVCWARIKLKNHTLIECLVGILIGFISIGISYAILP